MEIGMYKGYEMNSAVSIGLKKVYLGTNLKNREAPYIVVVLDGSRSFIPEEEEVYHGTDYMVMLQKFMDVCSTCRRKLMDSQLQLNVPLEPLDKETLLKGSMSMDFTGRLIAIKPESLLPEYRNQAYQVIYAKSGFGTSPTASGRTIFATELATGDNITTERSSIMGVLDPEKFPDWVPEKLKEQGYLPGETGGTWKQTKLLRLYCPLHATLYEWDEYGSLEDRMDWNGALAEYAEEIDQAIKRYSDDLDPEHGLMEYYHGSDRVKQKVWSYFPKVVGNGSELYGMIECRVTEPLNEREMYELIDDISGQLSDGWGEGFEQQDIRVSDGVLNVSFWSSDDRWTLSETMPGQPQSEVRMT